MPANNTQARAIAMASAWKQRMQLTLKLYNELKEMLAINSDIGVDWANGDLYSGGEAITVDASDNIGNLEVTPTQISNAVSTAQQIITLIENGTPTTGDHLSNLNVVSSPLNIRPDRVGG